MSEVFQLCEASFYKSIREAQKLIKSSDISETKLTEASQSLTEASQQINKMEIQYTLSRDPTFKNKIDLFKEELRNYKKELSKMENQLKEQQQEQHSGPLFESDNQKGTDALLQAKRQMYQNQAISNQVALNLRKNNETLLKNVNRMGDINNQLTVAHKLVNSIKTKLRKNKLVMWGTFGFLLLVLLLIIYTYFRDQTIAPSPSPSPSPVPTDLKPNNIRP